MERQKEEMYSIFSDYLNAFKDLDYVACWFVKCAEYISVSNSVASLVSTNSVCQGEQIGMLWPIIYSKGVDIIFAHTSFPWKNNAAECRGHLCYRRAC